MEVRKDDDLEFPGGIEAENRGISALLRPTHCLDCLDDISIDASADCSQEQRGISVYLEQDDIDPFYIVRSILHAHNVIGD